MATPQEGQRVSAAGLLIALGFIFGDLGTSPLYVLKAVVGHDTVSRPLILGSLSCIFWTLIFITTIKYVYLALKADNRGEGGIFALYARVRRYRARWAIFPAMIGCATLMADAFLTPAMSVTAAVEGIHRFVPHVDTHTTMLISGAIIVVIFLWQQFRAQVFAEYFGYIMFLWFALLGGIGFGMVFNDPSVFGALNPMHAINFVLHYKGSNGMTGFWLLGAVFLCTTGCEALYSDMGRCGKSNIRLGWAFIFPALMLNYLGQGAWLLKHFDNRPLSNEVWEAGVFFSMLPLSWTPFVVVFAIIVAILVSEALLAGVFTMVNEAVKLKLWFNVKVSYPSQLRGQVYMPWVNWFVLGGCLTTLVLFKTSAHMEEAYGLAIVIDMVMTSALLLHFIHMRNQSLRRAIFIGLLFGGFEILFLIANFHKLSHGGWWTLLVASVIFFCVFIFWRARKIRNKHTNFVDFQQFKPILKDVIDDETIPRAATNLVFMALSNDATKIDSNIIYSICKKQPKRADIYWFLHVEVVDAPNTYKYKVTPILEGKAFYIQVKLGFKVEHTVNKIFKQIVENMQASGEVDEKSHYPSLRRYGIPADFKFILLNSRVSADETLEPFEQFVVRGYRFLKQVAVAPAEHFGLEGGSYQVETVPINVVKPKPIEGMERIK
jgi:KUP system potassium uptake protein